MKKLFPILLAAMLAGCSHTPVKTITISNPSDDYRVNEAITIPLDSLNLSKKDLAKLVIKDEEGKTIAYQLVEYPEPGILFLATTKAHFSSTYTLVKGKPEEATKRVHARFVPERKDDFAWENERAAYRMYGPALAPENPSNGVDLWLKSTNELVVDSFYYREHELHLPYHINYGKGLDCYKVGHTAGCGGWFPMLGEVPQVGMQYDRWEILSEGPLSVTFRLYYDHYPLQSLDSAQTKAQLTVTCTSCQQLCKAEVEFDCQENTDLKLSAGIFLHTATANPEIAVAGSTQFSDEGKYIAYAENAVADAGDAQGRNYVAVVMPDMESHAIVDNTLIAVSNQSEKLTYWFGGGWSEWKYPTDADWFSVTSATIRLINDPSIWTIQ